MESSEPQPRDTSLQSSPLVADVRALFTSITKYLDQVVTPQTEMIARMDAIILSNAKKTEELEVRNAKAADELKKLEEQNRLMRVSIEERKQELIKIKYQNLAYDIISHLEIVFSLENG